MSFQSILANANYTSANRLFETTSGNAAMNVKDFFVSEKIYILNKCLSNKFMHICIRLDVNILINALKKKLHVALHFRMSYK